MFVIDFRTCKNSLQNKISIIYFGLLSTGRPSILRFYFDYVVSVEINTIILTFLLAGSCFMCKNVDP